ncbi:MAG: flagellar motor switch protein FliN [Gammaproteobacteria bacterium]|jgi:flagellar motor switch protein FliN/FliY|nr:flagellar motor switch protein FliN [Gammaproteobacteria bacterium]
MVDSNTTEPGAAGAAGTGFQAPDFEEVAQTQAGKSAGAEPDLDVILDVPVTLSLEVGRAQMSVGELLRLSHGAVVELDRKAGEPLDVLVNGALVARGEIVVVNDKFGIRLTEVVSQRKQLPA